MTDTNINPDSQDAPRCDLAPGWQDIRTACDGLQQAMDAMIDQSDFTSFRPSIARAIALARDEKQCADHPIPSPPALVTALASDRFECIAIDLSPRDIARLAATATPRNRLPTLSC